MWDIIKATVVLVCVFFYILPWFLLGIYALKEGD